jgi:hypothetical protein
LNSWKGFEAVRIIEQQMTLEELGRMATDLFGNMVKAVVDVDRELLAVDGELHADLEALLLRSRGVESADLREIISRIVAKRIRR